MTLQETLKGVLATAVTLDSEGPVIFDYNPDEESWFISKQDKGKTYVLNIQRDKPIDGIEGSFALAYPQQALAFISNAVLSEGLDLTLHSNGSPHYLTFAGKGATGKLHFMNKELAGKTSRYNAGNPEIVLQVSDLDVAAFEAYTRILSGMRAYFYGVQGDGVTELWVSLGKPGDIIDNIAFKLATLPSDVDYDKVKAIRPSWDAALVLRLLKTYPDGIFTIRVQGAVAIISDEDIGIVTWAIPGSIGS